LKPLCFILMPFGSKPTPLGSVIDLFLSYRATSSWQDMVSLVEKMAPPLAETVLVREQLALALNRLGRRDEAEDVLTKLIEERGRSSGPLMTRRGRLSRISGRRREQGGIRLSTNQVEEFGHLLPGARVAPPPQEVDSQSL